MPTSFHRPPSCIAAATVRPSGETRGRSKTRSGEPAARGERAPVDRSTITSPHTPCSQRTAAARVPSGVGSAPRSAAPSVTRRMVWARQSHTNRSPRVVPPPVGAARTTSSSPPGRKRGSPYAYTPSAGPSAARTRRGAGRARTAGTSSGSRRRSAAAAAVSSRSSAVPQTTMRDDATVAPARATARCSPSAETAGSPVARDRCCTVSPVTSPACERRRAASSALAVRSTVKRPYSSRGVPPYTPANASSNEREVRADMRRHRWTSDSSPCLSASHSRNADPARYAIAPAWKSPRPSSSRSYGGRRPSSAHCRSTAARMAPWGRPLPVSRPSTTVAYPSRTHRGARSATGPVPMGRTASRNRVSGLRLGRVRCARWANSWMASSSAAPRVFPSIERGSGGVG